MTQHHTRGAATPALTIGALGVVFGDIGTSPLYSLQAVFSPAHGHLDPSHLNVYGVISLVFWAITLVVLLKYVLLMLRADNDGEGGILALTALLRQNMDATKIGGLVVILGIVGTSLFFGDSVITPAISILSAIEGVTLTNPGLAAYTVPIEAVTLTALFLSQRYGTGKIGVAFGPVMALWFLTLAALGLPHIATHPQILASLSPTYAAQFVLTHPGPAFVALGAVVLTVTGAEALYADMGHFGKSPIRVAWFGLTYPALIINYLGQGALVLEEPETVHNPFFNLAPSWASWPVFILATFATIIASQAVISGAYSMARQAELLGYLPRLTVKHTSATARGQIYLPAINWLLYGGVMLLLFIFQSSGNLASAYGLAVTGTLLLTSALFLVYAVRVWAWRRWKVALYLLGVCTFEVLFFSANVLKIPAGGWIPLVIGIAITATMLTWHRGITLVQARHTLVAGSKANFMSSLPAMDLAVVPGTAVYLRYDPQATPLSLRSNVMFHKSIHENIIIVRSTVTNRPHVHSSRRLRVVERNVADPAITMYEVRVSCGFMDDINIPRALEHAAAEKLIPAVDEAIYFVSRSTLTAENHHLMPAWQRLLFAFLFRNAARPTKYFRLPFKRTVTIGTEIKL